MMAIEPRSHAIRPLLVAASLLLGSAAGARAGTILAYGNILSPPFVLAQEGQVLTLNGYPLVPIALPSRSRDSDSLRVAEAAEYVPTARELSRLRAAARAEMEQADSPRDALERAGAVFEDSPGVSSVDIGTVGLIVRFSAHPAVRVHVTFEKELQRFQTPCDLPGEPDLLFQIYQGLVDHIASGAAVYAFGIGYVVARSDSISAAALHALLTRAPLTGADADSIAHLLGRDEVGRDLRNPGTRSELRRSLQLPESE